DGIRDYKVTGVQTCALPICEIGPRTFLNDKGGERRIHAPERQAHFFFEIGFLLRLCVRVIQTQRGPGCPSHAPEQNGQRTAKERSEERRGGKERREREREEP